MPAHGTVVAVLISSPEIIVRVPLSKVVKVFLSWAQMISRGHALCLHDDNNNNIRKKLELYRAELPPRILLRFNIHSECMLVKK